MGREVRIALELHCRGDAPGTAASLTAVEQAFQTDDASMVKRT